MYENEGIMMEIKPFPNGIFGATTYLIWDEESLDGAMVDCTSSVDEIEKIIKKEKINLKYILITHGHFDHVYCLNQIKEKFKDALILMNKEDVSLLNHLPDQCLMAEVDEVKIPCIDGFLDENSKNLKLGNNEIRIIHTPGHTEGGVCYLINDILFSGDTIFKNSIGRCDLYGGDFNKIEKSIKEKIFKLNDNITVYPGHGDKTTIGYEKKYNSYFGANA